MRTAIIADDEELSIDLIKYLIKNDLPIQVIGESFAGDEALDMINKLKPDIVFIDIRMPILNGLEVIKKIKDSQKYSIDFIVITAYSCFEYAQLSLRLEPKDILLKPIESEQFVESVEKILEYTTSDNQIVNNILEYIHNNYRRILN